MRSTRDPAPSRTARIHESAGRVTPAEIPGRYTAPASRAYLYYTAEQKHWVKPLEIEIMLFWEKEGEAWRLKLESSLR